MRCLIVHHWDADGISSAALLYLLLRRGVFGEPPAKITNVTPKIGIYSLKSLRLQGDYDLVIFADICFPKEEVLRLKRFVGAEELWIFDHHVQEEIQEASVTHVNPIIKGESREKYPSASWLLAEHFRNYVTLPHCEFLKVLGAVGDLEGGIKKTKAYQDVKRFLDGVNMSFEEFLHVVELVDSNYRVGCNECVEDAVLKLLEAEKPQDVLKVKEWRERAENVRAEIEKCVSGCNEQQKQEIKTASGCNVLICELDTRLHIISAVTRRLAAANPEKIVVVVNRGFEMEREQDSFVQIYVRTHLALDLTPLIQLCRAKGCSAGGKPEVIGVVASPDVGTDFLRSLKEFLTRNF
ncbi:MAG: ssDNA-specific exonuclease RecJ [Candidatus Alkanophagales archaeon MCA70_species_2]|nr:ssDNA-specific exonuclease RecJ [Candidatus Alkanophaga liquidiphilum]